MQITALYKTNLINFELAERLQKLDLNVSNIYYIIISKILYFAYVPKPMELFGHGAEKYLVNKKNNQINEPYLRRHIITVGAASSR